MQTVGFAAQPFDTIAIHCLFKIPAPRPETRLQGPVACPLDIVHPEGVERKTLAFPEQPFDQFATFKPFLFAEREFPGNDGDGLFQIRFVRNRQFMTALGPAAGQYLAAIGGLHTFTESVNGLAATRMRLKCTFHCLKDLYPDEGTAKLGKKALPANGFLKKTS